MSRKYLNDIGVNLEDTPQGWLPNDPRQEKWAKEREIYGFDERETWDLTYSFYLWLYERLSMYNEVNCINTSFHKFEFKGEVLTQQQCIDRMLEGLKIALTIDYYDQTEEQKKKVDDIVKLFALCFHTLWW